MGVTPDQLLQELYEIQGMFDNAINVITDPELKEEFIDHFCTINRIMRDSGYRPTPIPGVDEE